MQALTKHIDIQTAEIPIGRFLVFSSSFHAFAANLNDALMFANLNQARIYDLLTGTIL